MNESGARYLTMVCFNMPDSLVDDPETRKLDEEVSLKVVIDEDMKLGHRKIQFENLIRLGRPKDRQSEENHNEEEMQSQPRPLRFQVKTFDEKPQILEANAVLKNHPGEVKKKCFFMTPDFTQKQRKQSF